MVSFVNVEVNGIGYLRCAARYAFPLEDFLGQSNLLRCCLGRIIRDLRLAVDNTSNYRYFDGAQVLRCFHILFQTVPITRIH